MTARATPACERCPGPGHCERCPQCGACPFVVCGCMPAPSIALGHEGCCEGCGRTILEGDAIHEWDDDVVTHVRCPERAQA
jgi:hypothetical protein